MNDIRRFRQAIRSGRLLLGAAISFTDPLVIDALAGSVGFVWIDMEHSGMTTETVARHLLACRSKTVPALVRVVGSGATFIKPLLDAGAEGIIVPQVRSAAEVRDVVNDCRYPPLGRRGFGPRVPSNYGREQGRSYIQRANRDLFVAVQIENVEALKALDEILSVPQLDGVVIGPADLSLALGLPGETHHPRVVAAFKEIITKARAAGITVGAGVGPDPKAVIAMARRGVQWMHVGADAHYLWQHFQQMETVVRHELRRERSRRSKAARAEAR